MRGHQVKGLIGALVGIVASGCATQPSVDVTRAPPAPLNLTRMGVYFYPGWRSAPPTGDTRVALEAYGRVRNLAQAMAQATPETMTPLLAEHGVTVATEPESGLLVLYMTVGNVQRTCYDNESECTTRVQVLGQLSAGDAAPLWSFESWMIPANMNMDKFQAFERDIVKQMVADGVIPK